MPRYRVCTVDDLPPGRGRVCAVPGAGATPGTGPVRIALFNVGGRLCAIDNLCPHLEGPLGAGKLAGSVVTCPLHLWRVDVTDGLCLESAEIRVATFPVETAGGEVFVTVPAEFRPGALYAIDPSRCWECGAAFAGGGAVKHADTPLGPVCRGCAERSGPTG